MQGVQGVLSAVGQFLTNRSMNRSPSSVGDQSEEPDACKDLFDKFDKDKNGQIDMSECVIAMEAMGPLASTFVAQFNKLDVDGSGTLSRSEFYAMYKDSVLVLPEAPTLSTPTEAAWQKKTEEERGRLMCMHAFRGFDSMGNDESTYFSAEDKDGKIEMIEALRAMKRLVGPLAKNFPMHFIKHDSSGDGYLDAEEFYALYLGLLREAGKTPDQMVVTKVQKQMQKEVMATLEA